MTKATFLLVHCSLTVILLASTQYALAQGASLVTNASAKPFFQSIDFKDGVSKKMDFSVRTLGSVKGRVFDEPEPVNGKGEQRGISGVKVSLRSRDPRYANFVIEQYTDEIGAYKFDDLRPGEYSIEIDPRNLPPTFHKPGGEGKTVEVQASHSSNVDLRMSSNRQLTGTLYIDRNRNGRYDPRKDVPVPGAVLTVGGSIAVSDAAGSYRLTELTAGRISVVVRWPRSADTTHVVLDLGDGAVRDRTVDVPYVR